ncbi:MAG: hypothetical protein KDD15_03045 [Lewinella sp.]|nr:hypothetical protein [Lewinella sp.]
MMKKKHWIVLFFVGTGVSLSQCGIKDQGVVLVPEHAFEQLSEYHFFVGDLADLQPNEHVLPYDLNTPLFSDYAQKARFVWMPEGRAATYREDGVLDFPEGTVLIKNFYYEIDETAPETSRRIVETRLLINRGDAWEAIGYVWNDEQTEASLEVAGAIKAVEWTDKSGQLQQLDYIIPNKNQCKNCHAVDEQQVPIGPKAANLNKPFTYADGEMNQLEKWSAIGYLSGYIAEEEHAQLAVWNDAQSGSIHERALAYLDVNCGHCHNPHGAANTSGLTLTAQAKMDKALGIYKPTVSAGAGTGGHLYSIVPGNPDESILVYRMNSTDPGAMMPELGRRMVHREGVELIREWIAQLSVGSESSGI